MAMKIINVIIVTFIIKLYRSIVSWDAILLRKSIGSRRLLLIGLFNYVLSYLFKWGSSSLLPSMKCVTPIGHLKIAAMLADSIFALLRLILLCHENASLLPSMS
jgi:hypothetical protein